MKDIGTERQNGPDRLDSETLDEVGGGVQIQKYRNNDRSYCKTCKMVTPKRYKMDGTLVCDKCGNPYN